MANVGKFKIGTRFVGNNNKAQMEVVDFKKSLYITPGDVVIIKDLKTGKLFTYGLKALERCNATIMNA